MKSLLFTAILSLRKRSEQLLIKFAILLQIGLTHAQTFFRGVPRSSVGKTLDPKSHVRFPIPIVVRQTFQLARCGCTFRSSNTTNINLVTSLIMPSSLLQVVNSLFQTCYNNLEQAVRTQLVGTDL